MEPLKVGKWLPPAETAFDEEKIWVPPSKMERISQDIVPLSIAIGVSVFIVFFMVGLSVRVFVWAAGVW